MQFELATRTFRGSLPSCTWLNWCDEAAVPVKAKGTRSLTLDLQTLANSAVPIV